MILNDLKSSSTSPTSIFTNWPFTPLGDRSNYAPKPQQSLFTLVHESVSDEPLTASLCALVFFSSILYHLVEEKTSTSMQDFNYSWFLTLTELIFSFLVASMFYLKYSDLFNDSAQIDRIRKMRLDDSSHALSENNLYALLHVPPNRHSESSNSLDNCDISPQTRIFAHFQYFIPVVITLMLSRGLATVSLQHFRVDYPTYVICRTMKIVFVMFLSVFWLRKQYQFVDWVLAFLMTLSVILFRIGAKTVSWSNDLPGVFILMLATFLAAAENSAVEKIIQVQHSTTIELLMNTNLISSICLGFFTLGTGEFMRACGAIRASPIILLWITLRGISYALWIHFSVALIGYAGALTNQYVSATRKFLTVVLSFVVFGKSFAFTHFCGFVTFGTSTAFKIYLAHQRYMIKTGKVEKKVKHFPYHIVEDMDLEMEKVAE